MFFLQYQIEHMRYLSYDMASDRVILVPVVSGDNEKWVINNDVFPDTSSTIESGSCVSTF